MNPRNVFGSVIGNIGNKLSLPEMGISEWIGGEPTLPTPLPKMTTGVLNNTTSTSKAKTSDPVVVKNSSNNTPAQAGGVNYYSGGSTGASQPAYNPETVAQLDQSINLVNDAISRLGTQLNIARGNIGDQYSTTVNELNSSKSRNKANYSQSSTTNQQNMRTNRNAILDQQSSGLRGLMRQLGAYGAVGSDLNVASGEVQNQAQRDLSGAGQTFAQNQQGLDTSWNNYLSEWANSKRKADDWKKQQMQSVEQQSLSTKQDLLSQLAGLRGNRAAAMGGGYAQGAAGDLAQARGLSSRIDQLGRFSPSYTGKTPNYAAPELASYLSPQAQQVDASNLANNATANPSLALLLGLDERQRQL